MLLAIIKKELLLVRRDLHSLAVLFLMPLAFILIMSLSLQDSFETEKGHSKKLSVGLVFNSSTDALAPMGIALTQIDGFNIKQYPSFQAMSLALESDHLIAGATVPDGLISAIKMSKNINKEVRLQLHFSATTPEHLRQLLYSSINRVVVSFQLEQLLLKMTPDPLARQKQKERFLGDKLLVKYEWNQQQKKPSSVQQSVPAWLIFSMFFVVIPIAMTFLVEKQLGTLQRLKTMPVPPTYFLIGKLVPYLVINLVQAILMFLVGIYLIPAIGGTGLVLGQNAGLLIPMTISVSFAAICFALFIATLVKTTEQATTIGGTSNLLLAAIGGIMVPTFVMPDMMQKIAQISPMNWGLEGYLTILLKQGDFISIVPEMAKLIIFASIFFGMAMFLYRRAQIN